MAFVFLVLLSGCEEQRNFVIKIGGTAYVKFHGTYWVLSHDGSVLRKQMNGTVPMVFNVQGDDVFMVVQKDSGFGDLHAKIIRVKKGSLPYVQGGVLMIDANAGTIISGSKTGEAYGIVSVSTDEQDRKK